MLKKLQRRWKVNGWNLLLILITFATGGSLCGYAARKILLLTGLEKNLLWVLLYIILITLLWPVCVIILSAPLGQFAFFRKYLLKIVKRIGIKSNQGITITKIAIFASGKGSNAKNIIEYFNQHTEIKVELIASNNREAGVLEIAKDYNISSVVIDKQQLNNGFLLNELNKKNIGFIVLAGFLLKLPPEIIRAFPRKIINIHPALLPAYGGKGMYGANVHAAVIRNREKQSGITIHYADEIYDHGEIILQVECDLTPEENLLSLTTKVQELEHHHYPRVIESVIKGS